MAKPISLGELAVRAGVSPATASIVLNDRPLARHVAEKTRARIQRLATEFNYRPNHLAKAMLQQSTRMIGFICGDIATRIMRSWPTSLPKRRKSAATG